jgi:hypothetical protein
MEQFLKRKLPAGIVEGTSNARAHTDTDNASTRPSLILSAKEVNLDELPYDPADRKRITEYPRLTLQDKMNISGQRSLSTTTWFQLSTNNHSKQPMTVQP